MAENTSLNSVNIYLQSGVVVFDYEYEGVDDQSRCAKYAKTLMLIGIDVAK